MALTKNISTQDEERFIASQLGKYYTLAHAAVANTGLNPTTVQSDKTVIGDRDDLAFDATLLRLFSMFPNDESAIGSLGSARIAAVNYFSIGGKKMKVILRGSGTDFMETIQSNSVPGNRVGFNGSFCGISYINLGLASQSPADPADVAPVGHVFAGGANVGGGRPSPDGFHVQYITGRGFSFGQGDATGGDGMGGLTPVIMKQPSGKVWRYGEQNQYNSDLPNGSNPPLNGPPGNDFEDYLIVRSNLQYAAQIEAREGKTILGFFPGRDIAVVIVQPKNPDDGGLSLDVYRDMLFQRGCEFAVGLDGSDSATLYDYKTKTFLVEPGSLKNNYLEVAAILTS